MKKKIILLIISIVFILPTVSSAQDSFIKYKGIKSGVAWSKWAGDDAQFISPIRISDAQKWNNINGGAFVAISLTNNLVLQTEINYSSKGSKFFVGENIEDKTSIVIKNTYIELPISIINNFNLSKKIKMGIYGGTGVSYFLKGDAEIKSNGFEQNQKRELDNVETFDYSLHVGGMFIATLNNINFHVDVRYSIGQKKLFSDREENIENWWFFFDENSDIKNRQLSFSLGVEL